jgi:hypothetical protein
MHKRKEDNRVKHEGMKKIKVGLRTCSLIRLARSACLPEEFSAAAYCPGGPLLLYIGAPVYHNSKLRCLFGACCDSTVLTVLAPHLVQLVLNLMYASQAALPALRS